MKYIDAERLKAEIERRIGICKRVAGDERNEEDIRRYYQGKVVALEEIQHLAPSLQQEQPDNEDIDKVAQELYEHLYELKRRNNVPTNLYDKKEIIALWKAGIEYAYNHPKQEKPEVDLEEYIENEIKHYGLSPYEASYGKFSASQIDRIIRNAFEFGLNARKED